MPSRGEYFRINITLALLLKVNASLFFFKLVDACDYSTSQVVSKFIVLNNDVQENNFYEIIPKISNLYSNDIPETNLTFVIHEQFVMLKGTLDVVDTLRG